MSFDLVLLLYRWENCGQVKVVLKAESEEDMLALQVSAVWTFSWFLVLFYIQL